MLEMPSASQSMNAHRTDRTTHGAGDCEKAKPAFRWASGLDPDNPMYGHSAAQSALRAGDAAGAERLFQHAIQAIRRTLGSGHPLMVLVAQDLAELYEKQGRVEEMRCLARRVVACISPPAIAQSNDKSLRRVAHLCGKTGHLRDAIPFYRSALACRRDMCGDNHSKIARCLAGLADIHRQLGDLETSRGLLAQARLVREAGKMVEAAA
jgi:tetratricopeptide (TPR) repeat protein